MAPLDAEVSLSDKYRVSRGAALMNGMQALVRLTLEQADADRDAGLRTGGYVSGYRGSPIGAFDLELMRAREELEKRSIVFNPGLNEDLAATAVAGTQTLGAADDPSVDGVFGVWYGKGPGVDRSIDAIKHASFAGATPKGGMLFLMGDDPVCKSSTTAHQSEQAMISAFVPVLFPASVHDYVPLGLHAIAMSRYSGAAVGLKIVTDTADSTATVMLDRLRPDISLPPPPARASALPLHHMPGLLPPLEQETRMFDRLEAVRAYARANRLNHPVIDPRDRRLGVIAVGKAHSDVMSALRLLGLSDDAAAARGIGVFRVQMVWPLETGSMLDFIDGYDQILVVEEKRPIVEADLARLLVNAAASPVLTGKAGAAGAPLIPEGGELTPQIVAAAIAGEAAQLGLSELSPPPPPKLLGNAPASARSPFFCAGCPHNRSTRLPDGSLAGAGIGCHAMSVMFDQATTQIYTQMGGEGMHWVGRSAFAGRPHMFQNLGDGTFVHSGLLAIRAAVAAKDVNITYKILCNDAVAMTGGQAPEGHPLPADIARQVLSVGVRRVAVVSDDVAGARGLGDWPTAKVDFHDRGEHIEVQKSLREEPGVTALLYVQTCAAEKRRRRKRGLFPDPPRRVVINPAVCEGCGDCGLKSNCVAIKPLDTEFGTKRQIDQTACNKDYSCLEGFCPSFVTVEGEASDPLAAKKGILHQPPDETPPEAPLASLENFGAVITGIGGTGVVTVAAVLGMAARLEGLHALALDQTGLSQKNGAVQSHLQIGARPLDDRPARVGAGEGRALIACDMLVGAGDAALGLIDPEHGRAIANGQVEPLPLFARDPTARPDGEALAARLGAYLGEDRVAIADVSTLARALVGDGMGANLMLVGVASQSGALPVSPDAIERAIRLNGAAVDMNLAAFRWGRWLVVDRARVEGVANAPKPPTWQAEAYDDLVARFEAHLTDYQSARYARRFRTALAGVEEAEERLRPGRRDLSRIAARALVKTMAIKDEYEVARLHTHPDWLAKIKRDFAPDAKVIHHLAPPMLSRTNPTTGEPMKRAFGPWIARGFGLLRRMKGLRGTPFDIFGRTDERRAERALVGEVEGLCALVAQKLSEATEDDCRALLEAPLEIKGFGHVKMRNMAAARPRMDALRASLAG